MSPASQVKKSPAALPLSLLILACAAATSLTAQDLIMSTPREPLVAPVLRDKNQPPPPLSQPPPPPDTPFRFGPIVLHPRLNYGYLSAEGLPALDGRRIASEIHTITAGLSADIGEHLSLEYSPTWMNYTARAMTDTFDQSASVSGAYSIGDWGIQLSENYAQATPTLVETGRQTKQETWSSSLGTGYSFSPSVRLQASVAMNERYTDIAADTRSWTSGVTLNLVFSPRLNVTLGPSFSYTEISDGPDMYSETYTARFSWQPTDKLTFALSPGMQYSHSTSSAGLDLSNPLLNFSLGYQPFETTSLSFSATQTVTPSYFKSQVTKNFRWTVGLNQRLFGRFYLNVGYAPYDTDYSATDSLTQSGRKDSMDSYNASISTQIFGRLAISATYTQSKNNSNQDGFSFSTKQYGLTLSYSY